MKLGHNPTNAQLALAVVEINASGKTREEKAAAKSKLALKYGHERVATATHPTSHVARTSRNRADDRRLIE